MAQEIAALSLKEPARKRLTEAIGAIQKEVRALELRMDDYTEKLNGKRLKDHDKKEFARAVADYDEAIRLTTDAGIRAQLETFRAAAIKERDTR